MLTGACDPIAVIDFGRPGQRRGRGRAARSWFGRLGAGVPDDAGAGARAVRPMPVGRLGRARDPRHGRRTGRLLRRE